MFEKCEENIEKYQELKLVFYFNWSLLDYFHDEKMEKLKKISK